VTATQQNAVPASSSTRGLSVVRVALSGPRGCFADAASRQLLHSPIQLVPCTGFDEALTAVQQGRADAAVLPRENTLIGTIMPALDAVLDRSMRIVAETVLRVEHHLIAVPGGTLDEIHHIHSHPAALAQCTEFLRAYPTWQRHPEPDTATAVLNVMKAGDRGAAAIASRDAAALYGGLVLCSHLEDSPRNFTRFSLLMRADTPWPADSDTLSLELEARHEAGALARLLDLFAERGLSVLTIETRPDRDHPWHLRFVIEVFAASGGVDWEALEAEVHGRVQRLRVLGRYRAAIERRPEG
jgi:prephenate dehydratase